MFFKSSQHSFFTFEEATRNLEQIGHFSICDFGDEGPNPEDK